MLNRAQKEQQVAELQDKFGRATSVYLTGFRGVTVQAANELRARIRSEGGQDYEYRVVKNSLIRRASAGSATEGALDHLEGPTALALSYGDPVGLARVLVGFAKENRAFEVRGGVIEGRPLDGGEVARLATLPTLEVLRGQIVGLLQAPATKLARLVSAPGTQIARVVEARRQQLEEGGS